MARTQTFANQEIGFSIRSKINAAVDWTGSYSYNTNDITHYLGTLYASLADNNLGNLPTNKSLWKASGTPSTTSSIVLANTQSQYQILTSPVGAYSSAIYNYSVFSGSNGRAGSINSIFINNTASWSEVASNPIGNTGDINLSVQLVAGNVSLYAASSNSLNWTISAQVTYI